MAEYWTTEQVAEHLDIEVRGVYQSRRNGEYPGNLGTRRGRRLMFRSDHIEAGPQEPETTQDPTTALLWALTGIHETLRVIHNELRAQRGLDTTDITVEITGEEE